MVRVGEARAFGDVQPIGRPVRRVAVLSVHSSPIAPPGTGDSGGMNVWIRAVASELARRGVASDLFTRADDPGLPGVLELEPGVRLVHLPAGPRAPLDKEALPGHLAAFLCSLLHARHAHYGGEPVAYDLIHSHYWLSGRVARLARERWQVPWVHSFHTLGKVKNATIEPGEEPEPAVRLSGEERIAAGADRLIVPTPLEAAQLVELYGAPSGRIEVVGPGVDGTLFHPGDRSAARGALAAGPLAGSSLAGRLAGGRPPRLLAFVGRLQALKGPEVAVQALAELCRRAPGLDAELLVVGGPSGAGRREPERLAKLAARTGVADRVHLLPAQPRDALADVYRAADLLLVPSRSESFGLVALEAQACGTPVLATRVGGLCYAVGDGTTGLLLPDRDPATWAAAAAGLLGNGRKLAAMRAAAAQFSRAHSWPETADRLLGLYTGLAAEDDPAALERTS